MRGTRLLWMTFRFMMACPMALLVIGISTVTAADRSGGGVGPAASISNGLLRVAVDPADGKLLGLEDLAAKHNHVGDTKNPIGLWELGLAKDDRRLVLKPEQAGVFQLEARKPWRSPDYS